MIGGCKNVGKGKEVQFFFGHYQSSEYEMLHLTDLDITTRISPGVFYLKNLVIFLFDNSEKSYFLVFLCGSEFQPRILNLS